MSFVSYPYKKGSGFTFCAQRTVTGALHLDTPEEFPMPILTPWCRVPPEQLTDLQLVKKFPTFHGTWRFITALTSIRHLLEIHPNIIHPSTRRSPQWSPSLWFPHQDPIHPLSSPICATCLAYLILLDFIARTILGEEYRSFSSSLCNLLHSHTFLLLFLNRAFVTVKPLLKIIIFHCINHLIHLNLSANYPVSWLRNWDFLSLEGQDMIRQFLVTELLISLQGQASFVLVIQKHPKLVTFKAQAYHIKCVYQTGEQNVTLGFNVSMLTTAGTIANTGPPPTCIMKIITQTGQEINQAEIGDNLQLQVEVQPASE